MNTTKVETVRSRLAVINILNAIKSLKVVILDRVVIEQEQLSCVKKWYGTFKTILKVTAAYETVFYAGYMKNFHRW